MALLLSLSPMLAAQPAAEDVACTMQYDPVCGVSSEGVEKTYPNGCAACSDRAVASYRAGACSDGGAAEQTP